MLSERALLVRMKTHAWSAKKLDRAGTETVRVQHGTSRDAGVYVKKLFGAGTLHDKIMTKLGQARQAHYSMTFPWEEGESIISGQAFLKYQQVMSGFKEELQQLVAGFYEEYDSLVSKAPLVHGTNFNPSDYPSLDEIHNRFGIEFAFRPVPEAGDFRCQGPDESDIERLRESLTAATTAQLEQVNKQAVDSLRDSMIHLMDKLNNIEAKRLHETTVIELVERCRLIPTLLVVDNPQLLEAAKELEDFFTSNSITRDTLKDSVFVRTQTLGLLEKLISKL